MTTLKKLMTILPMMILFLPSAQCQMKGKIGLSGTLQSTQFGIIIPCWLSDKLVLAPALDFKTAKDVGSEYAFGIIPRYYLKVEKLSPYVGIRAGVIISDPSEENIVNNKSLKDVVTGISFGGEYFFDANFSIGVEAQGNLTFSDNESFRFGNPGGTNFNLATQVSASVYF